MTTEKDDGAQSILGYFKDTSGVCVLDIIINT